MTVTSARERPPRGSADTPSISERPRACTAARIAYGSSEALTKMFRSLLRGPRISAFAFAPAAALLNTSASTFCGGSKADLKQKEKDEAARREQYAAAMAWVNADERRTAYAASVLKAEDGESKVWPLISERSLYNRLYNGVDNDQPFKAQAILTRQEELDIVAACKELNRHAQGIDRAQLGQMVLDSLRLRPLINRGRHYEPLSANARQMLKNEKVGQAWFTHFFAKPHGITEKRPCSEEILRAKWMTKENSVKHFAFLTACLERAEIIDPTTGKITDPRRVLNSDECPNPFGGTGHRGKVIAEVGLPCRRLVSSARKHTSLDVCVGLDGHLYDPHLIYPAKHIQRSMIPKGDKLETFISVTEKGYQTAGSLLPTLKHWDKDLQKRKVPKPVVWMTDGHVSRINLAVVEWCHKNGWIMYLSPPHTTGIHQPLDQIFSSWHKAFNDRVKAWCDTHTGKEVNTAIFATIFAEAWSHWIRSDSIVSAFRRCGVTVDGLHPDAIPLEKFVVATVMHNPPPNSMTASVTTAPEVTNQSATSAPTTSTLPAAAAPTDHLPTRATTARNANALDAAEAPEFDMAELDAEWESPCPERGSYSTRAQYFELKAKAACEAARKFKAMAQKLRNTPVTLKEYHPAFQPKKAEVEEKPENSREALKPSLWGDVTDIAGTDLEGKLKKQAEDEQKAQDEKDERKRSAEQRRAERAEEEARKRTERDDKRAREGPVLELLKDLCYIDKNADEVSAGAMAKFAKANRAQLRTHGIEVGLQPTLKAMMPQMMEMAKSMPESNVWKAAPPLALPAPTAQEDVEEEADDAMVVPVDVEAMDAATVDVTNDPGSAHGTPTKPAEKRTRQSARHG